MVHRCALVLLACVCVCNGTCCEQDALDEDNDTRVGARILQGVEYVLCVELGRREGQDEHIQQHADHSVQEGGDNWSVGAEATADTVNKTATIVIYANASAGSGLGVDPNIWAST